LGSHSAGGRHSSHAESPRRPYARVFTSLGLLLVGILIGGIWAYTDNQDDVAIATVEQQQGLNLNELCSAINADTIAKFRESGVIVVEVPPEFDDNTLIAELTRRQLKCSGETVSGEEANRRVCNNLNPTALRELATLVGVEETEVAKIGQDNTDIARDVFNCDEVTPSTSTTAEETTTTTTTRQDDVPADPDFTPENEQFNTPDTSSVIPK
jgi:hypothetical protein